MNHFPSIDAARASAPDASVHLVELGYTRASALNAFAAAMAFPEHFGANLDALEDCLNDLSWLPAGEHLMIVVGGPLLHGAEPRTWTGLESVLADTAARYSAATDERVALRIAVID